MIKSKLVEYKTPTPSPRTANSVIIYTDSAGLFLLQLKINCCADAQRLESQIR